MRYKHRPLAFACYAPEGAGSGTTPPEGGDIGDNANAGGGNPNPEGGRAPEEPLTFDQLLASNRDYQSEFDRKVTQALTKARQTWDREQAENMDEAKRLEKMTATERAQYQLSKDKAELQKRGLSADFAVYLTGSDAETSKANIDTFESLWKSSLSDAVNGRMRSSAPPRDTNPTPDYSKMSDAEYYAATYDKK